LRCRASTLVLRSLLLPNIVNGFWYHLARPLIFQGYYRIWSGQETKSSWWPDSPVLFVLILEKDCYPITDVTSCTQHAFSE
jgi:hypothetical protein